MVVVAQTIAGIINKRTPSVDSDRESLQKQLDSSREVEKTLRAELATSDTRFRAELAAADAREKRQVSWRRRAEQWIRRELRYRQAVDDSIEEEALADRMRIRARVTIQPTDVKDLDEEEIEE